MTKAYTLFQFPVLFRLLVLYFLPALWFLPLSCLVQGGGGGCWKCTSPALTGNISCLVVSSFHDLYKTASLLQEPKTTCDLSPKEAPERHANTALSAKNVISPTLAIPSQCFFKDSSICSHSLSEEEKSFVVKKITFLHCSLTRHSESKAFYSSKN